MLLGCHIVLVILNVLNGIKQKGTFQKLTWFGSALCWLVMCIIEIAELT